MFIGPRLIQKLVLAGVVLLGGCETGKDHIEDFSNVSERHQPTASRVFYSHDVLFSAGQIALNESEGRRLALFIESARISDSDKVFLVPGKDPSGRFRARVIADFLAAGNIDIAPLSGDIGGGGPSGQAVSVVVSRYVVTLPGCPDWTGERFTYNNVPTSNWGCADATNLGRMVARPEDLIHGRQPGAFDGEYGTISIQLYRKGETRALTQESVGPIENQQSSTSQSAGGQGQ